MGIALNVTVRDQIETFYQNLFHITFIGFPALCIIVFIIAIPFICILAKWFPEKYAGLTSVIEWLFCFLETDEDKRSTVVYGFKAPICYSYFLLFVLVVLSTHSLLSFLAAALISKTDPEQCSGGKNWKDSAYVDKVYDKFDLISHNISKPNVSETEYCFEMNIISGIEAACLVFGFSAVAMAINTWILLSCCSDKGRKCLRISCMIPVHIIGLLLPRMLLYAYIIYFNVGHNERAEDDKNRIINGNRGPIEMTSLYAIAAIADAFSMSFLTPWIMFKKKRTPTEENEDEARSYNEVHEVKTVYYYN